MVSLSKQLIDDMVQAVVKEVQPRRIYLFGSCARGSETSDSDVDFLIVEDRTFGPEHNRWSELKRIRKVLRPFRVPKDVLVYSRTAGQPGRIREMGRFRQSRYRPCRQGRKARL